MAARGGVGVRLFGEPAVLRDGRAVELPRMQGALLGALVLAGPTGSHADALADVLWPGPMPKTYETSLRVHVMKLRRALDDEEAAVLVRRPQGGYALDLAQVDVDVRRFSALVAEAGRRHEAGESGAAYRSAAEAVGLWSGDPYRGLEDAVDALAARSALEEQRLRACEILGEDGLRTGHAADVVDVLGPLFAANRTNERVGLPLVRGLTEIGRRAEAARVARDLQQALRTELGVTSQAAADLLDALQRPPAAAGRPPTVPPPLAESAGGTPFVGRADELGRLLATVRSTRPAATVTAVHGPAGIGKTRLLQELARAAHGAGVATFFGRADRSRAPYGPIASMAGRVVGRPAAGWPRPPGISDQAARSRLHDEVVNWLLEVDPALIVIDDTQWIDPDTATLLRITMDRASQRPCHLVLAWRPAAGESEVADELLADLSDVATAAELVIPALTKEDAAELATGLGLADVDPVTLFERTNGNPLLVHEVARLETRDREPAQLLVDLVSRRFLADGSARDLLRTAAVLGDHFTVVDLLAASDLSADQGGDALSDCERSGLLRVDGQGRAEFTHSVVAEVILGSLTFADRQQLHLRAFEALAANGGDQLAVHAQAAFPLLDAAEAVRSIARAASEAQRRLAFERADALHRQAIELHEAHDALEPAAAVGLYVQQARSLAHTDEPRCDDVRRRASSVAKVAASPELVADLAEANVGRSLQGTPELIDLLEAAQHWSPDRSASIRIRARLALERAETDRSDAAFELARSAHRESEDTADLRALGHAQRALVSTGVHRLPVVEHRRLVADLVATARAIPDLDLEMIGLIHLVIDRLRHRETDAAVSTLRGFQILADDRRWPRYQSFAAGIAGVIALMRGDRPEFERRARQATALAEDCGFGDAEVMVAGQKVCLAWHDGSLAGLVDILTTLRAVTDGQPVVAAALACALAEDGRPDEARDVAVAVEHATLPRGMLYSACLALLASYASSTGDAEMAAGLLAPLAGLAGTDIVAGAGVGHFGPAEGFIGRAHLALGDLERAEVAFDEAARSARSHEQVLVLQRLEQDRARVRRRRP